jgi:hypothetical protein
VTVDRHDSIVTWRLQVLLEAGYPVELAEQLAAAKHVDLHYAVELVKVKRCEPKTAAELLL